VGEFEGGIQIMARLSQDIAPEDIKAGMSLVVSSLKRPDGRISYEFKKG